MEPLLSPQLIKSLSTTSEMEELETVEKNSMVRVIYKCGNTYEGHVSESIPHGAGRLFFDDGATYEVTVIIYVDHTNLHIIASFNKVVKLCMSFLKEKNANEYNIIF